MINAQASRRLHPPPPPSGGRQLGRGQMAEEEDDDAGIPDVPATPVARRQPAQVEQTQEVDMTQGQGTQLRSGRGPTSRSPLSRLEDLDKSSRKRTFLVRAIVAARPKISADKVGMKMCLLDGSHFVAFYLLKDAAAHFRPRSGAASAEMLSGSERKAYRAEVWREGVGFFEMKKDFNGVLNIQTFLEVPSGGMEALVAKHSSATRRRLSKHIPMDLASMDLS